MNLSPRTIGGAFQKAGIHIEQGSKLIKTKINAKANNLGVDETIEQVQKLGQETKERLGAVDQAIENSSKIKNAYKEATRGTDSAASEAINRNVKKDNVVDSAVNLSDVNTQEPFKFKLNETEGGDTYSRIKNDKNEWIHNRGNEQVDAEEFTLASNIHNSYGGKFTNFEQVQEEATEAATKPFMEYTGGFIQNHPFASAGIAGGAGILGASLFGGGGDDDGYN